MTIPVAPVSIHDPVNTRILAVSEDGLAGFHPDPIGDIARKSGLDQAIVVERIRCMLEAGVIRRVRQTLLTTNLAAGALVAWEVPPDRLDAAFDFMFQDDPFSGHVVIRSTDGNTPGSKYRLWTTLKVPQGYSLERHADYLASVVGARSYRLMPAKRLFALGVGHTRRRGIEPGSRADVPPEVTETRVIPMSEADWNVLRPLKREFAPSEIGPDLWSPRAEEAGLTLDDFFAAARSLEARGIMGRFSTFLEHVKPVADGERVTRYNALFHWAVPPGMEMAAGMEVGRHHIMTHAYWREGGPEFANVNVMGVAHGTEKDVLLAHKAAIDTHLEEAGFHIGYTNVFWGGRSEIKPSEVMPSAYRDWCFSRGIPQESMQAT